MSGFTELLIPDFKRTSRFDDLKPKSTESTDLGTKRIRTSSEPARLDHFSIDLTVTSLLQSLQC